MDWAGLIVATFALLGAIHAKYDARRIARDKAEADRAATRDKMEFDAQIQALRADHATCAEHTASMRAALVKCEESHATLGAKMSVSECDRAELRGRLSVMESLLKDRLAPPKS